jgi:Tfp pilus assembly protein PilP
MRAWLLAAAAVTAATGCGDDEESNPPPQAAKPAVAAAAANANKTQLPEKVHVEDRVGCPIPDRPTDPRDGKCDLKAPSCGDHTYCLPLAQGSYCEPCPERDGIRHSFKERDFAVEQNRDPFQSFLLASTGVIGRKDPVPLDPTKKCLREDQMVAGGYSYSDLKLVGIVAQGTQRKVLMMGGPLGYIIKRGDCVGKEKAVVKDIGTGYITFQIEPDQLGTTVRSPDEYSVQLNPKQLTVSEPELPQPAQRTSITPVVPPPVTLPQRPSQPAPGQPAAVPPQAPAGQAAPAAPAPAGSAPAAGSTVIVPVVPPPANAEAPTPAVKKSYVPADTKR